MKTYSINCDAEQNAGDARAEAKMAKKFKRKRQKLLITELLMEFSKNTSLHGLKYINEKGITAIEKIFWFLTFIGSVGLCFLLISQVFYKWRHSPVIVSFSERMVPVGKVPFPSLTICPQWKCMQTRYNYSDMVFKFEDNSYNFSSNFSLSELEDVSLLCDGVDKVLDFPDSDVPRNKTLIDHIIKASPRIREIFFGIRSIWNSEGRRETAEFKKVLTEEGLCFNFNSLSSQEIFNNNSIQTEYPYVDNKRRSRGWTLEDGYSDTVAVNETYPRRGRGNGAYPDLTIHMKSSLKNYDAACNPLKNGFKIYLHHPADLPHTSLYYYAALPKQISSLALKVSSLTTSERLRGYNPGERQCYFPSDRQLKYFKIYTQKNCMIECRSNYTFATCGCVSFEMPHNDSNQLCSYTKMKCVRKAKEDLSDRETRASLDNQGTEPGACHCLPACDSITYDAEILKTDIDFKRLFKTYEKVYKANYSRYYKGYSFSAIELYFKEAQFVSMRRSELFGVSDFLANCGGLLGLFLGFSFLSLVEIVYFLTLRLCCILKNDKIEDEENEKES